jgi:hypothetical protein
MSVRQASKRPLERHRKKMLRRQSRHRKERNREAIRRCGQSGHRQCGKKARYDTRELAELVALKRSIASDTYLRVYRCPICGGWHITHTERIEVDPKGHA